MKTSLKNIRAGTSSESEKQKTEALQSLFNISSLIYSKKSLSYFNISKIGMSLRFSGMFQSPQAR